MTWNCLTLTPNGADDTDAAIDLIEVLELKYAEAAKPPGADVFHRRHGDGSHLFYFSPMASALFAEVLISAGASAAPSQRRTSGEFEFAFDVKAGQLPTPNP